MLNSRVVAAPFVFLAVLLSACPLPGKDNKQAEAEALIEDARRLMDICSPDTVPFRLTARSRIQTREGQWVEGRYSLAWESPERWKDDLEVPGYREIRVGGPGKIWRAKTAQDKPEVAFRLRGILDFAKLVQLTPDSRVSKVREKNTADGVRMCVNLRRNQWADRELCFSDVEGSLLLVHITEPPTYRTEFGEFVSLGPHRFPRTIREFERDKLTMQVTIDEIQPISKNEVVQFSLPMRAEEFPGCKCPDFPQAIKRPEPAYPNVPRAVTGTSMIVALAVQINERGMVTRAGVIRSAGPAFDEAAAQTITHEWLFRPASCGGIPVPAEVMVEVSFRRSW